jgi:hypothetical protein
LLVLTVGPVFLTAHWPAPMPSTMKHRWKDRPGVDRSSVTSWLPYLNHPPSGSPTYHQQRKRQRREPKKVR